MSTNRDYCGQLDIRRIKPGDRIEFVGDGIGTYKPGTVFLTGSDMPDAPIGPYRDTGIVIWDDNCEPVDCLILDLQSNPDYIKVS